MKNTLFDAKLFVHNFGSYLLHVPSLVNWANSKGLYFPETEPPIENYKFVQVELLLREYVRDNLSITPEEGFALVRSNPTLNGEKFARHPMTARWLLAIYGSNKMSNRIVGSIETGELKLLSFEDKAPITDEELDALLSNLSQVQKPSAGSDGLIDWVVRLPHTHTTAIETLQTESKIEHGETSAIRLIGEKGRQASSDKRLSHINNTNHLGEDEKTIIFDTLRKAQASIVLRYDELIKGSRLNSTDAVLEELNRLIGCDALNKSLYSLKSLPCNISRWRKKP